MNAADKKILREKQEGEAFWRFFTVNNFLRDCDANENLLRDLLDEALLPISFDNLEQVFTSLSDEQKATFAPANGDEVRSLETASEVVSVDEILHREDGGQPCVRERTNKNGGRMPDGSPMLAEITAGVLPQHWTREKLQRADRDAYKELVRVYGMTAINNRLAEKL